MRLPPLLGRTALDQRCRVQLLPGGEAGLRRRGRGAGPDGVVSGAPLAGISAAGSAPSPVNLAWAYGVCETYHSKSVLLSCLEARHLFIPFSFIQSLE